MSKVVVIDDEPFMLMILEDRLKRAGLEVVALRESAGAMDVIRRERPDLVILDWMMPEVSGIELCRMLKSDPELEPIPVFMLTARSHNDDERRGLKSGVKRYITKPFSLKALVDLVLEEVGGKGGG
ncbi:MAG: hypothetical protein Kow0025_21790 [Thermodesulfovibrionales bacterium]